jgi:transposase-like protein
MTPTKLSDSDKRELIRLYRQSNENTITLAKRYGVSSSTVRRIIQGALSQPEYEFLVQQKQKRLSDRTSVSEPTERTTESSADGETDAGGVPLSESVPRPPSASNSRPTIRKRSGSAPEPLAELEIRGTVESDLDVSDLPDVQAAKKADQSDRAVVTGELKAMLPASGLLAGEDFSDFEEDEDEDEDEEEDEDDLEDDFDEDLEDEDSLFEGSLLGSISSGESIELRGTGLIQVLPLSEASVPKICYLVVDRAAELITRPLKAFGELGQIPAAEIREKTLAVFDNHRVARRFATRNQRVFKIPDGSMLQKTAPYLLAKGITRLLIDGQVYSL